MNISTPILILLCGFITVAPVIAIPAVDDPVLVRLLDTPDETRFTGRFCSYLLDLPPEDLPEFRGMLTDGLLARKLPRRHAWMALGLTDTRWAETDPEGFIAACTKGMKEQPVQGRVHAAVLMLDRDLEAAIRAAGDLKLADHNAMPEFQTALAARDLQRAVTVLREMKASPSSPAAIKAVVRAWVEKDPQAAWAGIDGIPDAPGADLHARRLMVCSEVARRDMESALRLLDTIIPPTDKLRLQEATIRNLAKDDCPASLDLTRRINTTSAWKWYAGSAHFGSVEGLIEVLPKEHLDAGLTAFFIRNDDPVRPAFPNTRMLPLLPDPAGRRAMILAVCEAKLKTYDPLPAAVVDAAFGLGTDILSEQTPHPTRRLLLEHMLRRDPSALLPWLLAIREVEWQEFESGVVRHWPTGRLAADSQRLLAGEGPRERQLGELLARRLAAAAPVRDDKNVPEPVRKVAPAVQPVIPPTWERALKLGLATEEGRRVGVRALRRMAEADPKAALAAMIRAGETAMRPEFLEAVMRQFVPQDPAAALESALRLSGPYGRSLVSIVIREWRLIDRRAACEACLRFPPSSEHAGLLSQTLDAWLNVEPAIALEWILALPDGENRQVALKTAIRHHCALQPARAAELCMKELRDPLPKDLARAVSGNVAAVSYQQACRFILDLEGRISAGDLRPDWQAYLTAWIESDPGEAAGFLRSLPESAFVHSLNAGLGDRLLPKFESLLGGWTAPESGGGRAPKSLVEQLADGSLQSRTLTAEDLTGLRDSVLTQENNGLLLENLFQYLLQHGMEEQCLPLLRAAAKAGPGDGGDAVSRCIEVMLAHHLSVAPGKIIPFLESLGTGSPEWLDAAVGALWLKSLSEGFPSGHRHLPAVALLLVPAERRVAILGKSLPESGGLPEEWINVIHDRPAVALRLADLAALDAALAAGDSKLALQAVVRLNAAEGDSLLRRVLANFRNRDEAAAAIDALADPAARARASAWLNALNPSG